MYDLLNHDYYKKLLDLLDKDKLPIGFLHGLDIYHDDWCRIHRGGYCTRTSGSPASRHSLFL
jgi:hypothetical protein